MLGVLKVIPMLLALFSVINMLLDFAGIDNFILSLIGGISFLPLLFIYISSFVFRFCIYHRMFLYYVVVNNIITYIDYYIGIPVGNKTLLMIHLIIIGLFLFLILYFYYKRNDVLIR